MKKYRQKIHYHQRPEKVNWEKQWQQWLRPGDIQHQKLSNLVAKLAQLRVIQRAQRLAGIDGI